MSGRKDEGALEELSVAAMNRLRASLGLAPLCAPAPAATGPDAETVVPAAETPDAVAQRAAAAERAADARRTRELRARTQGLGAAILRRRAASTRTRSTGSHAPRHATLLPLLPQLLLPQLRNPAGSGHVAAAAVQRTCGWRRTRSGLRRAWRRRRTWC